MRSRIATIPQHLGLVPNLRVWQNVATGRVGSRGFSGILRDLLLSLKCMFFEVYELFEWVGIEDKFYVCILELFGG